MVMAAKTAVLCETRPVCTCVSHFSTFLCRRTAAKQQSNLGRLGDKRESKIADFSCFSLDYKV